MTLRFECPTEGVGIDPRYPPLRWEAWDGERWVGCEVDSDGTGGFNWSGDVVLHVPPGHRAHAAIVSQAAGWLRCRVVEAESWQPPYDTSPRITRVAAFTSGGTTEAVNAEIVTDEIVGESEGVPAQRFLLRNRPVVPGEHALDHVVDTSSPTGWEPWEEVEDFASSGPDDRHFVVDATAGEIVFGPAVREHDGTFRRYGAVPPKGAAVRIRRYRTGGGQRGNVARGGISVLKSSVPFVATVGNRRPAVGGTDGEDVENAKLRGPLLLRTRQRAVTAEDYENLARAAAPDIARVHCVPVEDPAGIGGVRVLVVPAVDDGEHGQPGVPPAPAGRRGVRAGRGPPRRAPDDRRPGAGPAARLRGGDGRDPAAGPGQGRPAGPGARRARPPCTATSTPSAAVPTATAGRSAGPSSAARCTRCCSGWPASSSSRRSGCSRPTRWSGAARPQVDRLDLGPHDLVFSWGHHVMVQTS